MPDATTPITVMSSSSVEGSTSNPVVVLQSPIRMVLVRVARTYVQSFLAFMPTLPAAGVPYDDFGQLVLKAASLAIGPAFISLVWNAYEVLNKLDSTDWAKWRA